MEINDHISGAVSRDVSSIGYLFSLSIISEGDLLHVVHAMHGRKAMCFCGQAEHDNKVIRFAETKVDKLKSTAFS